MKMIYSILREQSEKARILKSWRSNGKSCTLAAAVVVAAVHQKAPTENEYEWQEDESKMV